jgi:hypothetical protein
MKEQRQRVVSHTMGDCFGACVASIMELPIEVVPNDHTDRWWFVWRDFLGYFGLEMSYYDSMGPIWQDSYWIASVKSKNYKEVYHAIVMEGTKVAFDPSTAKRYRKGQHMLGNDLVAGGYVFTVIDFTKLHKLEEYRKYLVVDNLKK